MTKTEKDQLVQLSETVNAMAKQLAQNTSDTAMTKQDMAQIKLELASWSGGRKTLVWVIGVLLSMGIIISSIYEAVKAAAR